MKRVNFPGRKASRRANALVQQQESYDRFRATFERRKSLILSLPKERRENFDEEDLSFFSRTFEQNYGTFEQRYGVKI